MKCLLVLIAIGASPLMAQNMKWWEYDTSAETTACKIEFSAADLYKQLSAEGVSGADLKSKFPAVGWKSGKISASIVSTPREGDLVQNSLALVNGNVQFRLLRARFVRLTNVRSRVFVVEIDRNKVSANPTCTWSVDAATPAPVPQAPTRITIRQ